MSAIQKSMTETYTLKGDHCLWAKINLECINESVNVMISSDFGEFSHYWGCCGTNPKEFLIGLDMHYAMKKLMGSTNNMYEADFPARLNSVKKMIIQDRKVLILGKDTAKCAWDEIVEIIDECGNSEDVYFNLCFHSKYLDDVFQDFGSIPTDTKLKPKVTAFWNEVWLPFVEYLKEEIKEGENCGV